MKSTLLLLTLLLFFTACNNHKGATRIPISTNTSEIVTEFVKYDYWEGCETGKGECAPLTFFRKKSYKKWFLKVPCGGTFTSVSLMKNETNEVLQEINISFEDCPPIFDLTNLKDGNYQAYMMACNLGGGIEINLRTIE